VSWLKFYLEIAGSATEADSFAAAAISFLPGERRIKRRCVRYEIQLADESAVFHHAADTFWTPPTMP